MLNLLEKSVSLSDGFVKVHISVFDAFNLVSVFGQSLETVSSDSLCLEGQPPRLLQIVILVCPHLVLAHVLVVI